MTVTLFIPCFMDALYPDVAMSVVKVLERLKLRVICPDDLVCCGQPAFNSGYWEEARSIAHPVLEQLQGAEAVVVPSGSCGAMFKVFYPQLFAGSPQADMAQKLATKVWEFSEFLVDQLGVTNLGARFSHRVTFHDGCHGLRELKVKQAPRILLANVRDLELVEMNAAEMCCGFGGTFSAKFSAISSAMGEVKCASALETRAEYIVSNDSSCLMQIQGLAGRQKLSMKTIHLAEILAKQAV
jgi:L-lactate dehydrogenase complex protein LldE